MLNIAGPEYDFGNVVFVVLEECEHRRRGFEADQVEYHLTEVAKKKLAQIRKTYDEFGGSAAYWQALTSEVLETVMPQYIVAAKEMNALEKKAFDVWRGGDPAARGVYALGGLLVGGFVKALPFIPTIENVFVLAFAVTGFLYPDLKRYVHERRHAKLLNRLVTDAGHYQQNARLHYMSTTDIRESFLPASTSEAEQGSAVQRAETIAEGEER